jgi:hypothetical protein
MTNDTIVTHPTTITTNDIVNDEHNATHHDARVGGELGGLGGAVTGAIAGSAVGPLGTIGGAIIGGIVGAVGSSILVNAVDKIDDDTTISGIGHHAAHATANAVDNTSYAVDNTVHVAGAAVTHPEGYVPGIQTGGHVLDGTPDTRGITEKMADAVTGDRIDDKTGKPV